MKKYQRSSRKLSHTSSATVRARRRTLGSAIPELLESRVLMSVNNVFTVSTNADSGPGSLRNAVTAVNADTTATTSSPDEIAFSMTGGTQITLATALPAIANPVLIDGTTQSGYQGSPLVWLTAGSGLSGIVVNAITLQAGSSGIKGLAITGFNGNGVGAAVELQGANDFVSNSYLGLDPTGGQFAGHTDANTNGYGVSADGTGATISDNVISDNFYGIRITGNGTTVTGNDIGTDPTGMNSRGNEDAGITVTGASNVTIGGTTAAARNVISGNYNDGIDLTETGANVVILGNYIGLDATGAHAVPIPIDPNNISSGNSGDGIYVTTTHSGDVTGVTIGGANPGDANVISSNQGDGILIWGASGNLIEGNIVGSDASGQNAVGHQANGIDVEDASANTTIGGAGSAGNLILGNEGNGVFISTNTTGPSGTVIDGNQIGTAALPNLVDGILVDSDAVIGQSGAGNTISFNHQDGVEIGASHVVVNYNTIASNGAAGVTVDNSTSNVDNDIESNSIYANAALGIDLGGDGVTLNGTKGHLGPNNYQDFPTIASVSVSGTTVTLTGTLDEAVAGSSYTIDLYNDPANDPSMHGQGQTFVGSQLVTIGSGGAFTATFNVSQLPSGSVWSATATDLSGNTSEFSADFTPSAPNTQDAKIGLNISPSPATYGQNVTITATVTGNGSQPTGTVTFLDGSTVLASNVPLSGGVATFSTSSLGVATHNITVSYSGDSNYNKGSASATELVNLASSATSLSVNPTTSLYGQTVTLTATVSPTLNGVNPTGTVQFYDGSTLLGPGTLSNGVATFTTYSLGIGPHTLSAQYTGDANFDASTSNTVTETVNPLASTISGTVYNDLTGNGLTSDDTPLAGVTVDLFQIVNGSNVLVNSLVAGSTGQYLFSTGPGTFLVQEVVPANSTETAGSAGYTLNATSGTVVSGANFDNFQNMSVSGTVYNDLTGNGITSDDTPEAGVTVQLLNGSSVVASTTSGLNGAYAFSNLGPGNYTVQEVVPAGATETAGVGGYSVAADSGQNVTGDNFANFQSLSISGTAYQDLTGNGFSSDDTPVAGVTVDLFQSGTTTLLATAITTANGAYAFTNLAPGSYFVQEVVPSGWIETGGTAGYTIVGSGGTNSAGNNFDNFHDVCDLSKITGVYYVINGNTKVASLGGNTHEGDQVQVFFTLAAGYTDTLSLVSYTAPESTFVAADASKQVVFDSQSGTFTGGTHSLTITIPLCYYQIDFVCGPVIDHFGPAGSNVFYTPQGRKIDSNNGGTDACFNGGGELSGFVYDDLNADKTYDGKDTGIAGVIVTLTGTDSSGHTVHLVRTTAANGSFYFMGLRAGTYTITETQPAGYVSDATDVGTVNGTTDGRAVNTAGGQITNIVLKFGADGVSYDFGEIKFGCY